MMDLLKNVIRLPIVNKRIIQYYQSLDEHYISYHDWVSIKEKQYLSTIKDVNLEDILVLEYCNCDNNFSLTQCENAKFVIFTHKKAELSNQAREAYSYYFTQHSDCVLCYGDEDEWNSTGKIRMFPWLKSDFNPELLLQYFYI